VCIKAEVPLQNLAGTTGLFYIAKLAYSLTTKVTTRK